jgi:iron complex transport system substrate-binding protein
MILRVVRPPWSGGAALLAGILAIAAVSAAQAQAPPSRIVSLVPNLTDILIAIGARPQLVGVSSYDDEPEVKDLPRVGALLDPDVERIIALRPDLALVYGSQQDLMAQLTRASIPIFSYRHGGLSHVAATIREVGARTGRSLEAAKLVSEIERRIDAVRKLVAGAPPRRTLLVFGRERGTLRGIYASGGRGFLHDMLAAAGGINVFADVQAESVQASSEMVLSRSPDVIIEIRSRDIPSAEERDREMDAWKTLASLPAVRAGRLYLLAGKSINVPGPLVAEGVERIARALQPGLFK